VIFLGDVGFGDEAVLVLDEEPVPFGFLAVRTSAKEPLSLAPRKRDRSACPRRCPP